MALSLTDEVEKLLYTKMVDSRAVSFENIPQPATILSLLTMEDIMQLNKIAKSKRLASKPKEKFSMITQIMERRGFKKLAAGTNRLVFKYMENQSFVVKVAFCQVALTDNLRELYNQHLLKPFVTKVFDVTPCGTVGLFERVNPISSRESFMTIASDVYDIIINHLVGRYVIDDMGSKFFMNWGVRDGQFPVLLDFPYVFELDGSKLYCNKPDPMSPTGFCGGEIDYDDGFNYLVCQKCGKSYLASDLRLKDAKAAPLIVDQKGDLNMQVRVEMDGNLVSSVDTTKETAVYEKPKKGKKPYGYGLARREKNKKPHMDVRVGVVEEAPEPEIDNNLIPKDERKDIDINSQIRFKKNGNIDKLGREDKSFSSRVVVSPYEEVDPEEHEMIRKELNIQKESEELENIHDDIESLPTVDEEPEVEEKYKGYDDPEPQKSPEEVIQIIDDEDAYDEEDVYDDEYDEEYDTEYEESEYTEEDYERAKQVVEIVDDDASLEY